VVQASQWSGQVGIRPAARRRPVRVVPPAVRVAPPDRPAAFRGGTIGTVVAATDVVPARRPIDGRTAPPGALEEVSQWRST
jgi:hypothetical protein